MVRPIYLVIDMKRLLILACILLLPGCGIFDPPVVKACEAALKEKLRSPSSYERASYRLDKEEISDRDTYRARLYRTDMSQPEVDAKLGSYDTGAAITAVFTVSLSYDASNAYGAMLRDTAQCMYFSDDGDDYRASAFNVTLKTNPKAKD